ncbi:hypothetical protein JCM6882_000311 [Rhodosporidiobolus microsporus]
MPHADSLALPDHARTKPAFYEHVATTLEALLAPSSPQDPAANFITCLSNAASLLYGSYENFDECFGREDGRRVNWAGFYLLPSLLSRSSPSSPPSSAQPSQLLLGPFHGRPACLSVSLVSSSSRPVGVCAAGFLSRETVLVPDVNKRPGHIACDGVTQSEVVVPLVVKRRGEDGTEREEVIGVLDIDCEAVDAFGEEDRVGLELFIQALNRVVNWDL